jgi:hypothetical protein
MLQNKRERGGKIMLLLAAPYAQTSLDANSSPGARTNICKIGC